MIKLESAFIEWGTRLAASIIDVFQDPEICLGINANDCSSDEQFLVAAFEGRRWLDVPLRSLLSCRDDWIFLGIIDRAKILPAYLHAWTVTAHTDYQNWADLSGTMEGLLRRPDYKREAIRDHLTARQRCTVFQCIVYSFTSWFGRSTLPIDLALYVSEPQLDIEVRNVVTDEEQALHMLMYWSDSCANYWDQDGAI